MIKAVIFDMDGLMFNTEIMFKKQFRQALDKVDIHCPDSVIERMIGCDSREIIEFENTYPGISDVMSYCQKTRVNFFFEFFKNPGDANMPGLYELIQYLEKKPMDYAIASSSAKEDILKFINYAGFELHPKQIVSGKEGFPSKPAPDIFLATAKRMGYKPEECLVLEDSKHGITAAYKAGMKSIFIPDQIKPDEEMKKYIQETRNNLSEVIEYLERNA